MTWWQREPVNYLRRIVACALGVSSPGRMATGVYRDTSWLGRWERRVDEEFRARAREDVRDRLRASCRLVVLSPRSCGATLDRGGLAGVRCTLRAGHASEKHEARIGPPERRTELVASWRSIEPYVCPGCGAPDFEPCDLECIDAAIREPADVWSPASEPDDDLDEYGDGFTE